MIDWGELTLFIYITARMSGFVLFNPILGRQNLTGTFQSGFILVLSVFVFSATRQTAVLPSSLIAMGLGILLELALGYVLGLAMSIFFYIPQMGGHAIDTQMGMTMNQIYDASARGNVSVSGQLLNTLMTLLFFAAGGHYTLLRIMVTSGDVVAFGGVRLGTNLVNTMLELFMDCTVLSIKLCMPVLAAELIGQLGMGVLMKVIPQINVFSINIELKVIVGLSMMLMLIYPFSEFLLAAEQQMLDSLSYLLMLAG